MMHFLGYNSSTIHGLHEALTKKGISTVVEDLFNIYTFRTFTYALHVVFELHMKKEEEGEQNKNFYVSFSQLLCGVAELPGHFYNSTD